jgi:imidazolonepropionase-like amidohydrolase
MSAVRFAGALLACALVPVVAGAQEAVAIEGGTVHTVAGGVLEGATVVIENGRITAVGTSVSVPAGARRIDARGSVVTPGFIESRTNLGLTEVGLVPGTQDFLRVVDDQIAASFNVVDGLNHRSLLFPVTRLSGVTTAVSQPGTAGISAPGGPSHLISGQGALIDLTETSFDAMLVRSPVAMFAFLGEAAQAAGGGTRSGATARLRAILTEARLLHTRRRDFDRGTITPASAPRAELEAMVPVVQGRIPLVVTAHRSGDILAALRIADEFGIRLIVSGASEGWMVAEELARAEVPVVAKVLANLPTSFERLGARFDNVALMRRAGVHVAITGEDTHNARNLRFEAGNAVRHGMEWSDALHAVTLTPARLWGVDDRYGSIEPGKVANVVVWSGDPFEFVTRTTHVFIQGREVPRTSRELELQERYRPRAVRR